MTVPAARQLAVAALQELGVAEPRLTGEATLLHDAQFAGRRFNFEGGFAAAWLLAEGVLRIYGPGGLLRTIPTSVSDMRRAA